MGAMIFLAQVRGMLCTRMLLLGLACGLVLCLFMLAFFRVAVSQRMCASISAHE